MNNQTLVIYDFKILYQILTEIDEHIGFNLLNIKKISELNEKNKNNYLIISNKKLNLNSRKIFNKDKSLDLTERESNIIIFLNNSKTPVKISKLQTEVWGHNSKLETHTVETHIYRLRKKINDIFSDSNFIKSSKLGYTI